VRTVVLLVGDPPPSGCSRPFSGWFTLLDGDVVEVTVEEVGTLTNPVGMLAAARAASALRVPTAAAT